LEDEEAPYRSFHQIAKFKEIKVGTVLESNKWCQICNTLGYHKQCTGLKHHDFDS